MARHQMSNFLFRSYWLKFQKTLGETAVDVASIRKRLEEEPLALLGTAVGVQGWKLGDELSNTTQHGAQLHQVWPAGSRRQILQKHSMRRFSTRRTWPALAQATPAASTRRLGKQGWRVRGGWAHPLFASSPRCPMWRGFAHVLAAAWLQSGSAP